MSLIIIKQNQDLLWNVIHKNNEFNNYFNNIQDVNYKFTWFKNIISTFYNKYSQYQLDNNSLKQINREIITYMLNDIKNNNQVNSNNNSVLPTNQISTPPIVSSNRQEIYSQQFEQRQIEYEKMNKREIPKEVSFKEDIEEQPISNINELIKQQQEQRNIELYNHPIPSTEISKTNDKKENDNNMDEIIKKMQNDIKLLQEEVEKLKNPVIQEEQIITEITEVSN
jgi:hypothetical protein